MADSISQSSLLSCRIQRLSIHKKDKFSFRATATASLKVCGNSETGRPFSNSFKLAVVVFRFRENPQQWLSAAYGCVTSEVCRSLICSTAGGNISSRIRPGLVQCSDSLWSCVSIHSSSHERNFSSTEASNGSGARGLLGSMVAKGLSARRV